MNSLSKYLESREKPYHDIVKFLRYPGGKQRFIEELSPYLPDTREIEGNYIEPFVGGGSVFLAVNPLRAILADINPELIELFLGIKLHPHAVWEIYKSYPSGKEGYYSIRDAELSSTNLSSRAARTLFLNRTCFKGMWRHNSKGKFNVGYGGQTRRWVIDEKTILYVSAKLQNAKLLVSDFEDVIENCNPGDFVFLDPPYKPGHKELFHSHYSFAKFSFHDQQRLSNVLSLLTKKNVRWAMTNSLQEEILFLYQGNFIAQLKKGIGGNPGELTRVSNEVFICNYL